VAHIRHVGVAYCCSESSSSLVLPHVLCSSRSAATAATTGWHLLG
jgi:hypothetical protein